ncbi:glycosyltransferase [Agarivorans aestuarii]|uniref:Glycosyltransferase n=1 Tax=Agarivorans aestuarii TaxID=1563703 RepID=A0ABU7G0D7_9ALTE|nr:glycosyltransferase [Agarivorans aestuarii]MEE1672810.1 glycosyltransferase [Agarivorans aestuarii]
MVEQANSRLVISLTTISSRIGMLHKVIESILIQDFEVEFDVILHVSREPYLLDEGIQELPHDLIELNKEFSNFNIRYVDNIGPYRKILPVLNDIHFGEANYDYVVTVDDDTVYPPSWLRKLYLRVVENDCVVAYRGRQLDTTKHRSFTNYRRWKHSCDDVLIPSIKTVGTGKDGIIYKPEYFHPNVLNVEDALKFCGHADDLWLKVHTALLGVKSVLINKSLNEEFKDIGEGDDNTLYNIFNKKGGNDLALSNIQKYLVCKYGVNIIDVFDFNTSLTSSWFSKRFVKSLGEL